MYVKQWPLGLVVEVSGYYFTENSGVQLRGFLVSGTLRADRLTGPVPPQCKVFQGPQRPRQQYMLYSP